MLQFTFLTEDQLIGKINEVYLAKNENVTISLEIDEELQEELFYVTYLGTKKPTQILSLDKIQSILGSYLNLDFYKHDALVLGDHGYGYVFFY